MSARYRSHAQWRLARRMTPLAPAGVYVHVPFCLAKCAYCDFSSYAGLAPHYDAYVDAVCAQAVVEAPAWQSVTFISLFLGGGTPTVLSPASLGRILATVRERLPWAAQPEISLEANPGTVTLDSLRALRTLGINRLSLGVQSLQDSELALLGRIHTAAEAVQAVVDARRASFANLNLDLMYGLPRQTLAAWQDTLERALALAPEHLSLYALSLEEGTPLAAQVARGELPEPDADLAADMYLWAEERLATAGYVHYELSNWARHSPGDDERPFPALACRHNLLYWQNERYLGLGAAAATFDGQQRSVALDHPLAYLAAMHTGQGVIASAETLSPEERLDETVMLGLRLVRGIGWADLERRLGVDARALYAPIIAEQQALGLLAVDDWGMRLTPRGRLLGNRVFAAFLR
ncbi:MAG: radical SAM family heme chaperone HemW [Anaerolineales bacterium]